MKLSIYLSETFNKKTYGFGNLFSQGHLDAIEEFEKTNKVIFLKMSANYYLFNTKGVKFSIKTEKNHTITIYQDDKIKKIEISYYNFRRLYKTVYEILTKKIVL